MIRILHSSDVQLDAPFAFLGEMGGQHRQQLRETFGKMVDLAASDDYDLLLIAGDLFNDNRPSRNTVNFVKRKLGGLSVPVVILPGNHDCYDERSVYRKAQFPPNVRILTERPSYATFPELDLVVAGNPLTSRDDNRPPLQGIDWPDGPRWRVAMAHGNLQIAGFIESEARPIFPEDIAGCGADYVALGDWHGFADHSQGDVKAFYCGAPEPTALTQSEAGVAASVTLSDQGVQVERIRVGTTSVQSLALDIGGLDETEIIEAIQAEVDPGLMLDVTLTGLKSIEQVVDVAAVQDVVAGNFYYVQVSDDSATALGNIDLTEFPESHAIGQYVRLMQERIEAAGDGEARKIVEEALQIGVALLQGQEVLR